MTLVDTREKMYMQDNHAIFCAQQCTCSSVSVREELVHSRGTGIWNKGCLEMFHYLVCVPAFRRCPCPWVPNYLLSQQDECFN